MRLFRYANGLCILCALLLAPTAQAFTLPPNDGFVTDEADLLTKEQDRSLEQSLRLYRAQTKTEIVVLILESTKGESLENISATTAHAWLQLAKKNERGIVIVFSYQDRNMTILTGDVLSEELPDVVLNGIIDKDIMPPFKDGNYYEGIAAGIESIKRHLSGEFDVTRYEKEEQFISVFWYYIFIIFVVSVGVIGYRSKIKQQRRRPRYRSNY